MTGSGQFFRASNDYQSGKRHFYGKALGVKEGLAHPYLARSECGRRILSMSKFIFVTGGVASSVGKGITVASLGRLLKNHGVSVSLMKLDPYINVDPGTMSPYQHGEVFVTDDGAETDLDLGHSNASPASTPSRVTTSPPAASIP